MVGRAGGALAPALQAELAAQGTDGSTLQGLCGAHVGQQPGKTLGQHRLARARWPHQQQAVAACRGNFQGPLGCGLALDVGHVGQGCARRRRTRLQPAPSRGRLVFSLGQCQAIWQKLPHHVQQMRSPVNRDARHQGGLLCTARGQDQAYRRVCVHQGQRHGQGTAHRTQRA